MDTVTTFPQEGTWMSGRHIDVPFEADTFGSCPAVTEVLSRVGDKWSMQVVIRLGSGSLRFNELKRVVTGISQRMLTRTLRGLERDGLVSRTVTASVPPRVDYELTPLGHSLWNPVAVLSSWALANREHIHQAQERYDAQENNDNL